MPNLQTSALLFLAGCVSWTISIFSGGGGSVILLATVTHLIRVRQVAPVVTLASLMASPVRIAISWRRVEWRVVKWYLPGAMAGAMLGGWLLSWARGDWLTLIVGMFLVSSAMQYRLGERVRSFPMPLPCFIPVSVVVGLVSGLVGASSLMSLPFYLNYGLTRERLIATGAVHSLFIQITKIATYASVGARQQSVAARRRRSRLGHRIRNLCYTPVARHPEGGMVPQTSGMNDTEDTHGLAFAAPGS